ncbi:MAG TPA: hydroxysqualene dehydroxylase HpnE [Actinopolymorphaceae bacterium]|nr:hydroxysqualene dehydroxylase HpnE [Actinopolymorphaceae bacterium]
MSEVCERSGLGAGVEGRTVAVVGGGLAGIAAAVRLADLGARVTVLEARPNLGGATYSFQRGDLTVDTGQHVFLRCYTSYRALLDKLGVADLAPVQDRFAIPVLHRPAPRRGGSPSSHRLAWLRRGPGPAPLHLGPALLGYAPLSPAERCRAAAAALALRSVDPDDACVDAVSFGSWLRTHHQSTRAIERLWGLITVAALNLHPDEASLALAARVFRTGLLDEPAAADIGIPAVPLRQLHAESAERLFADRGVRLRTKAKVTAIEPVPTKDRDGEPGFVLRTPAGDLTTAAVVVAVPHQSAAGLVPPAAAPGRHRWADLAASPIVNVHLRYDRTVTALPFAASLDSPVQWIFDRTKAAGVGSGQYLVVSVSAAHAMVDVPTDELRETYTRALAELFPAARNARLAESFVTREPHATFRQGPGTAALRPATPTQLPGLVLAGAWTATGWPDAMEGAVRSGLLAADSLARDPHTPGRVLTEATP